MNSHELSPSNAISYIVAGHGKATLIGKETRYTYRFSSPKDNSCVWVSLLTGLDNTSDYQYLGYISTRPGSTPNLLAGRKGNKDHPAFVALAWYLNKAWANPEAAEQAVFMHEGTCGKCGRELTVLSQSSAVSALNAGTSKQVKSHSTDGILSPAATLVAGPTNRGEPEWTNETSLSCVRNSKTTTHT